ncbi:MAG TPA: PKD domain-containing protein [Chitinophagaceae bacterium]
MKVFINCIYCFFSIALVAIISCKKEYSCEGCATKDNKPPIAMAGPDKVITLPTDSVLLDGSSSSDPDGMISEWLWTKISGPASFNILKPIDSFTKVKTLVVGTYQFELKVTDNGGLFSKDTMRLIVDSVVTTNHPPIANAGADQTITLPTNAVNLDGSGSTDPENNITSYAWTKISGPGSFNIVNPNAVQTQVTTLSQGTYQFELKVTDAPGLFSKDTMQVIVNATISNNLPPIAIAGNDTTIQTNQTSCAPVPITITLNGSNSYDADGSITSYLWSGSNGISNPNAAITTISGSFQGTISVILKVTDNNGAVGYDTMHISIIPANRPLIPAQLISIGTLPETRGGFSFAAAGNKIVFAGGSANEQQGCATARVDIYDISTGIWTMAQLSKARESMGVAVLGNKIFFAGGIVPRVGPPYGCYITNCGDTRRSEIDIYDASTNTWSTAQLSNVRIPTGASAGNKVVFAGDDDYFSAGIDIYDAGNNSWLTSSLSAGRQISQPAVAGNRIFFGGGSSGMYSVTGGGNFYKQIDIYDATSDTWTVDSLSMVRGSMAAISANNKIYWGGGFVIDAASPDGIITNSVEIRDLATNSTSFDCLSEPKAWLTAVRKDNKIIFFGGEYYGISNARFDIYDLTTNSWSIGVLPQNLLNPSIISYNNILYVAGGSINGVLSNQVWKLEF